MYCGMKSLMNSIGGQYHQSRNKLSSPWITGGDTKNYHHHHHHHLSFNDKLNNGSESSVNAGTNRSSFSSESNDELENCSSELFLSTSPSSSTSASSTPKTKTNKKLKFGVDAILELSVDKKSQEQVHFNDTSLKRTSDSEYSPPSKKSFTNSPSTGISKSSDVLIKSLSNEDLDNERTSSCGSSPEPDGNTPRKNQSNPSLPHLFRPTFLYQMPYQQSQIPSFIPLLFATVDARQKTGQSTDSRLQQYLNQQHAYHMMVRTKAFQENSMNNVPTNHQLFTSPLRSVLSNSSQLPFTAGGYAMGNYSINNNNNNGCHSNPNNNNNLPSTTSNLKKKRSWSRAVFSNLQRKGLEKRFEIQKYVTKPDRRQLAAMLGLTDAQVKVWFQNRRMKWRHLEETTTHKKRDNGRHDDLDNQDENGIDVSAGEVKNETSEFPDDDDEQAH